MISAAVVGASGYVGAAIASAMEDSGRFQVTRVTRGNYTEFQKGFYDILINSAMPSKRFWAKNNPADDFKETVEKTEMLFKKWQFKKFIHISTVSARCESESVYGKHKAEAEKRCTSEKTLIVRLSAMFSPDLSKGSLIDILQGRKVFVSGESRYPFASRDFVCRWIASHTDRSGIVELGARNCITLREIANHLKQPVEFEGPIENQTLENPSADYPDASEVLAFMEQMRKR